MPRLLQVNSVVNIGSTGRIAEEIGELVLNNGWESFIAYGREANASKSTLIPIGNKLDIYAHVAATRILDRHGLGSVSATRAFVKRLNTISPDIIHLHNVHGYYINYEILFEYLASINTPVVWTLHDCWSFTGHCSYYSFVGCEKWVDGCFHCPQLKQYPGSFFQDRSVLNYQQKKKLFNAIPNLSIVPVSKWLQAQVERSFLKNLSISVIPNGVDTAIFAPKESQAIQLVRYKYKLGNKPFCLGVAFNWQERKGLKDFILLREMLDPSVGIVLVGLTKSQIKELPVGIIGIERTNNKEELAALYAAAEVFINPTWEDNYPTTNLESISCGTPVITYKTGGSPESISEGTGFVVEQGNISGLTAKIEQIKITGKSVYLASCRKIAINLFDKKTCFQEYLELYRSLLN